MRQRVLILGSGHFVGRQVATALAASDWATPILFEGSIESLGPEALEDIHSVFNGALGQPAEILSHARALFGVLDRPGSTARVVHLSSMTVYGSFTGVADDHTAARADLGAYGSAQIAAEALAAAYPYTVILRPGCEYGPGCPQWSERIARLLLAHRLGDLGPAGDGRCNLVYIDDLVGAVVTALREPDIDGQAFNLAMPSPPTWNQYFMQFGRALGAVPVPWLGARRLKIETKLLAPPLKILEKVEQRMRGRASWAAPALTPSLLALCAQDITLDSTRAAGKLDINWTPLPDGLRRAAGAYRAGA